MPSVRLLSVPYDSARPDVGMGAGPAALIGQGIEAALRSAGHQVAREEVRIGDELVPEIARTFAINRRLAELVGAAVRESAFPLVLTGNCNACLGTVAGLGAGPRRAVLWLDAHADLDTPEDNESGFFDVMALSILTGACWRRQASLLPGFRPVAEEDVVLLGARDLEPYQRRRLEASNVRAVDMGSLAPALSALAPADLYLHLDVDVLDPSEGRANRYAAPGGPSADEVAAAIGAAGERLSIRAATISAYDPAVDPEGRVARTAVRLAVAIADAAVHR